jgi:hypothetical protein
MAKSKSTKVKWHHVHKIRVHDNRWLVWTIALAVLACASLVAYIRVTDINFQTQMNDTQSANWTSFTHKGEGYTVRYPKSWGMETEMGTINFVSSSNQNEYFSVSSYPLADEKTLRSSLFNGQEGDMILDGKPAWRLNVSRSQTENVVMVKDSSKVYVIRGRGGSFDQILSTFKFQEKLERV